MTPFRHEDVASLAADTDAQVTGQLAICKGSYGPDMKSGCFLDLNLHST